MTQEGVRNVPFSLSGERSLPWQQRGGIRNWHGKRSSSAQKRLEVNLPHLTVIHQSPKSPFQANSKLKVSLSNPRAQVKEKTIANGRKKAHPCPRWGAQHFLFQGGPVSLHLILVVPLRTKLRKAIWGPPTPVPLVLASPPHIPPLTWVILSTETGIPSMVRGGSSELTSCGTGACSAKADSRSSRIMLLYFRTCRELRAEVNKMPNSQEGSVPGNQRVGGAGLPQSP